MPVHWARGQWSLWPQHNSLAHHSHRHHTAIPIRLKAWTFPCVITYDLLSFCLTFLKDPFLPLSLRWPLYLSLGPFSFHLSWLYALSVTHSVQKPEKQKQTPIVEENGPWKKWGNSKDGSGGVRTILAFSYLVIWITGGCFFSVRDNKLRSQHDCASLFLNKRDKICTWNICNWNIN